MKSKNLLILSIASLLFFYLFYQQSIGINLFIFEAVLIGLSFFIHKDIVWKGDTRIVLLALVFSAFFVVLYASQIAIAVNIIFFFLFLAYRMAPDLRSTASAILISCNQLLYTPENILVSLVFAKDTKNGKYSSWKYRLSIILVPLLVIFIFILMYMNANSRFNEIMGEGLNAISGYFSKIFEHFSWSVLFTFMLGFIISSIYVFKRLQKDVYDRDQSSTDLLHRKRKGKSSFGLMDLKKEYQAMLFLLIMLNLVILCLNVIDIDWVWLHYTWNGGELKEFVHQGTYILILSIVCSAGIAIYIFRNNINFYKNNIWLKRLTYIWLIQNIIMALSVGMRTYRYIQHFNLAHLRIGLLYFLIATILFLMFIILKIRSGNSTFYLVRKASLAICIVFFMLCPFDWDKVIVDYNFKHSTTAFVHRDWTMTLSDKTLPIIHNQLDFMDKVAIDSNSWHRGKASDYSFLFTSRVNDFIQDYGKRDWQSWNYADAKAYELLTKP